MWKATKTKKLSILIFLIPLIISLFSFYLPQVKAEFGEEDIIFEYGAENATLATTPKPPYEEAGCNGNGLKTGSYAHVDDTYVRTGDNSIKFYQISGTSTPKSDAQRRIELRKWNINNTEFYFSWWMYFDSSILGVSNYRATLGGEQTFFGGVGLPLGKWTYYTNFRFAQKFCNLG